MAKKSLLLVFGLFSTSVYACNPYDSKSSAQSVLFDASEGVCISIAEGVQEAAYAANVTTTYLDTQKPQGAEYWDDWVLKSEAEPLLTQQVSDNYFGIGVWVPEDIESERNDLSTEEWLMSHGVQFSMGFGDKRSGEPRMRLDYLWHSKTNDSWTMQIEVPF